MFWVKLEIDVEVEDVRNVAVDVLVLKYAAGHHGADLVVARALGQRELFVQMGQHQFFPTNGRIAAKEILVLSVGALRNFDYPEINDFAARALDAVAKERPTAKTVGITIHGPGYGLDELASIHSLVQGLTKHRAKGASTGRKAIIIERDAKRAAKVARYLSSVGGVFLPPDNTPAAEFTSQTASAISHEGTYSKRLFAAMPFSDDYLDQWELAMQPAAHDNKLLIERLDHEQFTGDIVAEIRSRIERSAAVVALLDTHNPNVFLEVGYAWGVKKPSILLLHEDHEPPFDIKNQRLIRYKRVGQLKAALTTELKGLLANAAI